MTLLLAVVLVLSLAACGARGGDHMGDMDNEPKNAEEAAAMHKELTAQEAAILAENTALWEKVFMAADKGKIMMEDGKNYGDFLLETINAAKDQFSSDELKLLQRGGEDPRHRKQTGRTGGKVSRDRAKISGQRYEYAGGQGHGHDARRRQ